MIENITKEYIEECKCSEIQNLRPKFYDGDWIIFESLRLEPILFKEVSIPTYNTTRDIYIWLPQSHDFDQHIREICKKKQYTYFSFYAYHEDYDFVGEISNPNEIGELNKVAKEQNSNPLLARIRLLKALLKEEK
jgi:hypothetical protein